MAINSELEKLYQSWITSHKHFVSGGIVDEVSFASCEVKVLMLLKEVNDPDQNENWSLIDLIKDQINSESFYPVWERVGEWNFGIQNGFRPYHEITGLFKIPNIIEGLENVATTNLKKSGGGGESDYNEIYSYAKETKDLWTSEIEIIKPDLIICGGTFGIVKELLGFNDLTSPSGANIGVALNAKFIDFYHPMYRVSPKLLYAFLKETLVLLGY